MTRPRAESPEPVARRLVGLASRQSLRQAYSLLHRMYLFILQHIFDKIALADNVQYLVRASYLEIYNEEIRDLLSKVRNLALRCLFYCGLRNRYLLP